MNKLGPFLLTNSWYDKRYPGRITVAGRDKQGVRHEFRVNAPRPYYYMEAVGGPHIGLLSTVKVPLIKVEVEDPYDVPKETRYFENDINYVKQVLKDKDIGGGFNIIWNKTTGPNDYSIEAAEPPEVSLVRAYYDIEVEVKGNVFPDPHKANWMILTMVLWVWDPNKDSLEKYAWTASDEIQEKVMFRNFNSALKDIDFDVLIGWNIQFDVMTLVNRMDKAGIKFKGGKTLKYMYGKKNIRATGVEVYDLKKGFEKYFQGKKLESYALDKVAARSDQYGLDIPEPHFNYKRDMNRHNINMILPYNEDDVMKCYLLDKKHGIIDQFTGIKIVAGCNLDDTIMTGRYAESLILRACAGKFVFPHRTEHEDYDYEGAYVIQPKPGRYKNCATLDYSQMYPTMIRKNNMSFETMELDPNIVAKDPDNYFEMDINEDRKIWFRKDIKGILPTIFEGLTVLRTKIKKEMKQVKDTDPDRYKVLDNMQYGIKQCLAAMYGYVANKYSLVYYPEISECTTFEARKLIKMSVAAVEKMGYEVIYGDTDSIMVIMGGDESDSKDKIEEAKKLEDKLNELIQQKGKEEEWTFTPRIEFEQFYQKMFFGDKKKRYAGIVTWDGGRECYDLKAKGFELRRSDSSALTREVQATILKMVLEDKTIKEITKYLVNMSKDLQNRTVLEVGIPQSINKALHDYKIQAAIIGVLYSTKVLEKDFEGEKAYNFYLKHTPDNGIMEIVKKDGTITHKATNRVALKSDDDLDEWADKIDWKLQAEKILSNKIDPIIRIIDRKLTTLALMQGQIQQSIFSFGGDEE